jgi:hypothetical protein
VSLASSRIRCGFPEAVQWPVLRFFQLANVYRTCIHSYFSRAGRGKSLPFRFQPLFSDSTQMIAASRFKISANAGGGQIVSEGAALKSRA